MSIATADVNPEDTGPEMKSIIIPVKEKKTANVYKKRTILNQNTERWNSWFLILYFWSIKSYLNWLQLIKKKQYRPIAQNFGFIDSFQKLNLNLKKRTV